MGQSKIRLRSRGMPNWGNWEILGDKVEEEAIYRTSVRERGWPPRYCPHEASEHKEGPRCLGET